ncbi:hypothetical protein [Ponticaulis koreensis]|uniref:hypothetical protein n=1 Tax=Ponticaulis koreensis TaxID=1123045 RepID=UPI0003B424CA|nr:hypothetical protein [Ponticaulis koreensis]
MNKLTSISVAALSAAVLTSCGSTPNVPYFDYRGTVYLDGGMGCSVEYAAGNASGMPYDLIAFPGNRNFENHFENQVLLMTVAFGLDDGQVPDVAFYDDWQGPNAIAMNRTLNGNYSRGTILFGGELLWREAIDVGGNDLNTVRIATILAHEFAHLAQFSRGYYVDVPTQELMADMMAGWAIGLLFSDEFVTDDRRRQRLLSEAARTMFDIGDYAFNSPNHHGTPQQREAAFELGLSMYYEGDVGRVNTAFRIARNAAPDIRRGSLNRDIRDYL